MAALAAALLVGAIGSIFVGGEARINQIRTVQVAFYCGSMQLSMGHGAPVEGSSLFGATRWNIDWLTDKLEGWYDFGIEPETMKRDYSPFSGCAIYNVPYTVVWFPTWTASGAVAALAGLGFFAKRRWLPKVGECTACSHPLAGASVCPECGTPHSGQRVAPAKA